VIKEKQITIPGIYCEICGKELGDFNGYPQIDKKVHDLYDSLRSFSNYNIKILSDNIYTTNLCLCKDCCEKYSQAISKVLIDSLNDVIDYIKSTREADKND